MAKPILMPQVGQDLKTARINEWHIKVGDSVEESDIIATVESDKATFEVEAAEPGTVLVLLFNEGEEAEVLKPIAYIGEPGETIPVDPSENEPDKSSKAGNRGTNGSAEKSVISSEKRPGVSPSAKRLAQQHNIDLKNVTGSGPGGRIIRQDIETILSSGPSEQKITPLARKIADDLGADFQSISGSGQGGRIMKKDLLSTRSGNKLNGIIPGSGDNPVPFNKTRKRIAERLTLSNHTIPHFYLFTDVDFSGAAKWRIMTNQQFGVKISVNDILIKAAAEALVDYPELNSHVDDEKMIIKSEINIGVAVSTPDGLLVPVIPEADKLTIIQINEISKQNIENARRGVVNSFKPGTFTITNLGMYGIDKFLPIINPPECAILSAGEIKKRLVPNNTDVKVAEMMTLGLACDHRAVDGSKASQFLGRVKSIIENF